MASRYSLIVLLLLILIGCRPATPPPTSADQAELTAVSGNEATLSPATPTASNEEKEIRNAEYQLGTSDALKVVQLKDGKFEQGTPGSEDFTSISMTDFVAIGDLNADGTEDAAALVSENYGGTGVFVFLVVYSKENETWAFQTSSMVDDRPELRELSIANNEIFLDAVIHGTDDPMCCPALHTMRHYRFVDNLLEMVDYTTFTADGKPRTITIESPADGTEVFTTVPIKGKVAIAPFENNLVYRIFDVSGIELSAGAITVTAPDLGAAGTFDAVIPLGKVLSGALIRVEVQDQSAADGSLLAMDSVELVVQ